jgi:hypothetical protein
MDPVRQPLFLSRVIALIDVLMMQIHITSYNRTTNEDGKWSDITKWYKKEQKRYREAVKKGLVKENGASVATSETPKVRDGDVTCTGDAGGGSENDAGHREYLDPGPMPLNIYDRGFVENWKEVLFPISRRKEALEMGGYSRPARSHPKPDEPPTTTPSLASAQDKTD